MSSALQTSRSVVDALGCADFASAARTLACLCHSSAARGFRVAPAARRPRTAGAPSPTANTGAVIPRRQQSLRRSAHDSGALAVPVGECDQFVSAVIVAPDHLLLQPHLQMDAVHP